MTCSMHQRVDREPGFRPVGVVGREIRVGVFFDPFDVVAFFFVGETTISRGIWRGGTLGEWDVGLRRLRI